MKNIKFNQKGDTIVEVLVATVVLTIILAGAYTVVNRSTRINQTAIERTDMANQLTEQAELLRGIRSKYNPVNPTDPSESYWQDVLDDYPSPSSVGDHDCSAGVSGAFYLSTDPSQLGKPNGFSRGAGADFGDATDAYPDDLFDVWIATEDSPNDNTGPTIDDQKTFHIRGCWEGIGGVGTQRAEILLRLRQ